MQAKLNPQVPSSPSSTSLVGKLNFPGFQEILDFTCPTVDTYTKCLLHFNGADASTTTNEETGKAVTFAGNAQLDTTQSKFGGSSLLLDGTGDYISMADSADWDFGGGDFTVDFWIKTTQTTATVFCGQASAAGGNVSFYFQMNEADTSGKIRFYAYDTAGRFVDSSVGVNDGNWHHIAAVKSSGTITLYIDGTSSGTPVSHGTMPNRTDVFSIGRLGAYDGNYLSGHIDEFRISKGIARWTANFTPPTSEYTDVYSAVSVAVDGDTDKEYVIYVRGIISGATPYIKLLLNNDATSGRYGAQYIANSSASISAARTSTSTYMMPFINTMPIRLLTPSGFVKTASNEAPYWTSGTTMSIYEIWGSTYTQTGNVTSLNFLSSSGNFTSGTRITVFARRSQS